MGQAMELHQMLGKAPVTEIPAIREKLGKTVLSLFSIPREKALKFI